MKFGEYITSDDIKSCKKGHNAKLCGKPEKCLKCSSFHKCKRAQAYMKLQESPMVRLFGSSGKKSDSDGTRQNILSAFEAVQAEDSEWLKLIKKDLLDSSPAKAGNAIGKLCCYGELIAAFGGEHVAAMENDNGFEVDRDGERLLVITTALQLSDDERDAMRAKAPKKAAKKKKKSVKFAGHGATPADIEKVILRILQAKSDEAQLEPNAISILWIDAQDKNASVLSDRCKSAGPVYDRRALWSNELWYAFYGKKDMPIFVEHVPAGSREAEHYLMPFDGRFAGEGSSKFAAAAIAFPNDIVIYENPFGGVKLPKWFYEGLFAVRSFSYSGSKLGYGENVLAEQLDIDRRIVSLLAGEVSSKESEGQEQAE